MAKVVHLTGRWGSGLYALVDDEDYERVMEWHWRLGRNGYVYPSHSAKNSPLVPLAHFVMRVKPDRWSQIDHINRQKRDNRKTNLRIVTPSENGFNKGPRLDSQTQIRFVYPAKLRGRVRGYIARVPGHPQRTFRSIEKAAEHAAFLTRTGGQ